MDKFVESIARSTASARQTRRGFLRVVSKATVAVGTAVGLGATLSQAASAQSPKPSNSDDGKDWEEGGTWDESGEFVDAETVAEAEAAAAALEFGGVCCNRRELTRCYNRVRTELGRRVYCDRNYCWQC